MKKNKKCRVFFILVLVILQFAPFLISRAYGEVDENEERLARIKKRTGVGEVEQANAPNKPEIVSKVSLVRQNKEQKSELFEEQKEKGKAGQFFEATGNGVKKFFGYILKNTHVSSRAGV